MNAAKVVKSDRQKAKTHLFSAILGFETNCQARKSNPEKLFKNLLDLTSKKLEKETDEKHLWCGRYVKSILNKTMLEKVAGSFKEKRVGRFEPRVRKRRPKAYPLMQEPRSVLRAKMKFSLHQGFGLS